MTFKQNLFFPAAILSLFFQGVAPDGASEPAARPNVLFLFADDLNDWVGYGTTPAYAPMPNIEVLARRGAAFTEAHSQCPACGPLAASVMLGPITRKGGRERYCGIVEALGAALPEAFVQ